MNKCLVTKLNGSSNNSELLRLGEMRMKILKVSNPTSLTQGFAISVNKPVVLKIVDNGYFTDRTLTVNKGKTITLNIGFNDVWVSNDNVEIAILDKYSITELSLYPSQTSVSYIRNKYFNLSDLKYSTALTSLNLSNSQITGDIVNLKNLTSLTSLNLEYSQVNGDIVNLKNLTALIIFRISNTNVTGDIVNLNNLTRIGKELILKGLNISGNIGNLSNQFLFVSNQNGRGNFTWTTSSRTNILAMENIACDNIDKLLQDMSKMNANFAGEAAYYKTIGLIGTRTSASDAAVQTLQSKGYTVSITPA